MPLKAFLNRYPDEPERSHYDCIRNALQDVDMLTQVKILQGYFPNGAPTSNAKRFDPAMQSEENSPTRKYSRKCECCANSTDCASAKADIKKLAGPWLATSIRSSGASFIDKADQDVNKPSWTVCTGKPPAVITPLSKNNAPSTPSDTRPIAQLPELAKVLERIVHRQLLSHLISCGFLDPHQFGFRPEHSTQTAILDLTETIRHAIEKRKVSLVVSFHFSKAFDSIPHTLIIKKLRLVGCTASALDWFASYFSGRSQAIRLSDGSCSSFMTTTAGVPQGDAFRRHHAFLLSPWAPASIRRPLGPDRTELCLPLPMRPKGPPSKGLQRANHRASLCRERGADDHRHATTSSSCPLARKITQDRPMMRFLQLNLNHCEAARDLLCEHHQQAAHRRWPSCVSNTRTLLHPTHGSPMPTAKQLSGCMEEFPVQERPAREYIPTSRGPEIGGIFFFSVFFFASTLQRRLSEREFSTLLANITEEARGRMAPLVYCGGLQRMVDGVGECRETRPRASILLDSLARSMRCCLTPGSSIVNLTFVCETLTPRVLSWTVSGLYTHSDHQAIVFEIEDDGASSGPSTRRSYRWNAPYSRCGNRFSARRVRRVGRSRDRGGYGVEPHVRHHHGACDASMSKANPRRRREPVYTGGRPRSLISGAPASQRKLADSPRDRVAGMTRKPTARTTPSARRLLCAWRSRPASVGAGGSFATRIAMSRLGCPQAKQPSSPLLVRGAVAALFSAGAERAAPATAASSGGAYIPAVTLEETQRSSVEDKGALRAPGPDGIPNSALKIAGARGVPDIFLRVYTTCLETGVFSVQLESARDLSCSQSQANLPTSRPRIVRCACWTRRAKILVRIICDRLEAFTERTRRPL
ncbi:unnamed protein product [Trichogramma brassicae]|uniref:Reverse transcriptase domain-containing protein n=1 Tax=Trichogramma brassicae TaxID=86971 RepID=A0A6H5ICD0_9HYME|nr:unnamed protein product [Trichogramma brassicae]